MTLYRIAFIYLSISLISSDLAYAAVSLDESYKAASKTNLADSINISRINQATEVIVENRSNYFPKLYLKGNYSKQENLNDIKYANLNLTYSLYKGGKDFYNINIAENSKNISTLNKNADQIALYQNVILAFYNFFMNDNDAKNLELLTRQSNERVNEIQKRVSIGRSRYGELLQARAQLAQAQALLENAKGLTRESAEKFKALTGIIDQTPEVDINQNLNHFKYDQLLQKAYSRSDVVARELKIYEAKSNLSIARASHLPTLDLTSNYYLTTRTGTSYATSKTDWDVGLILTFPLFEGFNSDAKINETIQKEHEARYTYLDYKKAVEIDLSSKFETHNRYVDQIKTFDEAVTLAKKSYDEAIRDYRLGLITNLDVLTALNLYLDTKRNTEKNKIQAIMSEKTLEASLGVLP